MVLGRNIQSSLTGLHDIGQGYRTKELAQLQDEIATAEEFHLEQQAVATEHIWQ